MAMNVMNATGMQVCPSPGTRPIKPPIHHSTAGSLPVYTSHELIEYGHSSAPSVNTMATTVQKARLDPQTKEMRLFIFDPSLVDFE